MEDKQKGEGRKEPVIEAFAYCRAVFLAGLLIWLSSACGFSDRLDYPPAPSTPDESMVIEKASGRDDDNPMRGREILFRTTLAESDVINYYKEAYPESQGWTPGATAQDGGDGYVLCLAKIKTGSSIQEYLELYPYGWKDDDITDDAYVVSRSNLVVEQRVPKPNRCGIANGYLPNLDLQN